MSYYLCASLFDAYCVSFQLVTLMDIAPMACPNITPTYPIVGLPQTLLRHKDTNPLDY